MVRFSLASRAGFDVVRMGLFDRSSLSDSLYAVLGGGVGRSVSGGKRAA